MTTTQETRKEPTRSLETIKNLFNTDTSQDLDKLAKYESLTDKIVKIPIEDIFLDENIREQIDEDNQSFKSLLASIKKHGIQQNIVVEFRKLATGFKIVCVSGHRRVLAAKKSGTISVVPALIKQYKNNDIRIEMALAENLLREDLHCLDIAEGYRKLSECGWSREKLMETFGKTNRTIATYLKMGTWSEEAKKIIRSNPDKFTVRFLVGQIACKKYDSDQELVLTLKEAIGQNSSKKSQTSRKDKNAERLDNYLSQKKYKSDVIKAIKLAFKELKFIS